jgi:hypothetical protein
MRPDFDRLVQIVTANEADSALKFDMANLIGKCNTAGCLIGSYMVAVGDPKILWYGRRTEFFLGLYKSLRISQVEYCWLFNGNPYSHEKAAAELPEFARRMRRDLALVTKDEALGRLRKYIAYKRRKDAMIYDENGIREESRRAEGDHGFVLLAAGDCVSTSATHQGVAV